MKLTDRRLMENRQQMERVRSRRLSEFKQKHRKLAEEIESSSYQDRYKTIMGVEWAWPDTDTIYFYSSVLWQMKAVDKAVCHIPKNVKYKGRYKRAHQQSVATPEWRDKEAIASVYLDRDVANAIHGKGKYHVDHIVPVQGKHVSGLHNEFNLRVVEASENMSKGNSHKP